MTKMMPCRTGIWCIVSIAIVILLVSVTIGRAQDKKLAPINISYSNVSGNKSPLWIAEEMRLYEKYGLDAKLIRIPAGNVIIGALMNEQIDVSNSSGSVSIAAAGRGLPVVIVGSFFGAIYKLVANPGISSIRDLKGKTAGSSTSGSSTDFVLRRALSKLGLVPDKDVKILQTGIAEADKRILLMLQGRMDATLASPESIYAAEAQGGMKLKVLANLADMGISSATSDLYTRRDFLEARRDRIQAFFMAISEAIWIGKKNKEITLKVFSKSMKVQDPKLLDLLYQSFLANMPVKPYAREEAVRSELDILAIADPRFKDKKPSEFMDNSILIELDSQGFFDRLYR